MSGAPRNERTTEYDIPALRIIAALLFLSVLVAIPALGRASPLLPTWQMQQDASVRLGQSLMQRMMTTVIQPGEVKPFRKSRLVKELDKVRAMRFAAADGETHEHDAPAWMASQASAPASFVNRGPSGFHDKILMLPGIKF